MMPAKPASIEVGLKNKERGKNKNSEEKEGRGEGRATLYNAGEGTQR